MSARQIPPKFVPKIWGSTELEPWFPNSSERIGEVWFPAGELLIKFLFTTENLSVQVHPGDDYAREHEDSRGKTEMWHILRAEPGAKVALGFKQELGRQEVRSTFESGELMKHLAWHDAKPGDTFFTPAGTVHAIGAGLALCEIQQNSDVTYRIFDYGRERELHVERAIDVSEAVPHAGAAATRELASGHEELVQCAHFVTERLEVSGSRELPERAYAIVLRGNGTLDGAPCQAGTVWEVETRTELQSAEPVELLLTRCA